MRRLHLLVEGQTEETITRDLLAPHLAGHGWYVTCSVLTTKQSASGKKYRGGVSSWKKLHDELRRLITSFDVVSTVVDYYGLPPDTPGMGDRPSGAALARVQHVERAVAQSVGDDRFIPHFTLHETEAWVFAAADQLYGPVPSHIITELQQISTAAGGPESINDDPTTAPSKRLLGLIPEYKKTIDGPLWLTEVGLAKIRAGCPHLDAWLTQLEGTA